MDTSTGNNILTSVNILVQNGTIACMSATCSDAGTTAQYTLNGGYVIPGLVLTGADIGQQESKLLKKKYLSF